MKPVFGAAGVRFRLAVLFALAQFAWCAHALAADPQPGAGTGVQQESAKIEPYKGEPIYLDEAVQIAKPTIVTRETLKEKYEDDQSIRVEREIARYSDNTFAADGKYLEYHPNGKPFIEGQFKAGRHEGVWTYYFENGQVNRKAVYKGGKLDGSWDIYRADGTLAAKRGFKDGLRNDEWITYDTTGKQPLAEEHYVSGKEDGVWKSWYPNGKQKQEAGFKLGKREGTGIEWNDKGDKLIEATYTDGKLNGTATRYLPDGKTIVQTYDNGRFVSETRQ